LLPRVDERHFSRIEMPEVDRPHLIELVSL
jgi:hypothetical protein